MSNKDSVHLVDLGTSSDRNLLPLGVGLIASHARSRLGAECDFVVDFLRDDADKIMEKSKPPIAIGLALYMWNLRASMNLAAKIKECFPSVPIVCGGYSVPKEIYRKAEFFAEHPYVDILVHGEGEQTFADLMENILGGGVDLSDVKGITYQSSDGPEGFITTAPQPRIDDLDTISSPFLNGIFDDIMERHADRVTGAIWETNRGCPFSCTFCDWGNADVFKVKKYGVDRLIEEVEWMASHKINYVNVADANYGIFHKRDLEIATRIAEIKAKSGFPQFMAINWTKNSHERVISIADRFAKGGVLTSVTLSVQSFFDPTLNAIKRHNIKNSEMEKLKASFHAHDLPTNTDIILGLPEETYDSFMDGIGYLMRSPRVSDHWLFNLCFLLENAELSSKETRDTYNIQTRFCSSMVARSSTVREDEEYEEIVVGTSTMPLSDWMKAYLEGFMCVVLQNFRVAFFPIVYMQREYGVDALDYVRFLIQEVSMNRDRYERLRLAIEHLERQREKILASDSAFWSIPELGGTAQFPAEGILAILLDDVTTLYQDLLNVTKLFVDDRDIDLPGDVLEEIIAYQKMRMPVWPIPNHLSQSFVYNLAEYFEIVSRGGDAPPIKQNPNLVNIRIPKNEFEDQFEFASQRTRYGHTMDLYDIDFMDNNVPQLVNFSPSPVVV